MPNGALDYSKELVRITRLKRGYNAISEHAGDRLVSTVLIATDADPAKLAALKALHDEWFPVAPVLPTEEKP
jgi:ribosomal protein L7Ae-like RNA K-turn-binding protein